MIGSVLVCKVVKAQFCLPEPELIGVTNRDARLICWKVQRGGATLRPDLSKSPSTLRMRVRPKTVLFVCEGLQRLNTGRFVRALVKNSARPPTNRRNLLASEPIVSISKRFFTRTHSHTAVAGACLFNNLFFDHPAPPETAMSIARMQRPLHPTPTLIAALKMEFP
ncbi:unnamed protein product [Leptosia nina]|uniref:Uncharacterized protein n=1 Tax=Leptosia nina TaxID=320188 RepID=A0AAV1K3Q5_9NEOP